MYATIIDEEDSILNGRHGIVTYLWPVHGADGAEVLGYTSKLGSAYSLTCYFLSLAMV